MAFNMKNRSLLSLVHHTPRELHFLLDLSRDLKRAKYTGTEEPHLKGKNIALAAGLVAYQGRGKTAGLFFRVQAGRQVFLPDLPAGGRNAQQLFGLVDAADAAAKHVEHHRNSHHGGKG